MFSDVLFYPNCSPKFKYIQCLCRRKAADSPEITLIIIMTFCFDCNSMYRPYMLLKVKDEVKDLWVFPAQSFKLYPNSSARIFHTHCRQSRVNFCRFVLLEVTAVLLWPVRPISLWWGLQLVTPQPLLDGLIFSDDPPPPKKGGRGWGLRSLIRFKWDDWMLHFI